MTRDSELKYFSNLKNSIVGSYKMNEILEEKGCIYNEKLDKYILNWCMGIFVKKFKDDGKVASDLEKMVNRIAKPTKFIFGGKIQSNDLYINHGYLIFLKLKYLMNMQL